MEHQEDSIKGNWESFDTTEHTEKWTSWIVHGIVDILANQRKQYYQVALNINMTA